MGSKKATLKTEWVNNSFGHVYLGKRLYLGQTSFQKMEIFRNETFGTLLFLDGKIQISERDEDRYHQYLVDAPLLAHARPRSLGIIGGGDCFGLEEAIKHSSLRRILMVEIDRGVVDFCLRHYPALRPVLRDPRIEIAYQDARRWLEEHDEAFDVLAIDLTEPHGPSKMLYTREFYRLCRRRLRPGGILSIHTDNSTLFPESFATIYKTLRSVFPCILTARVDMPCFGMGWTYRLASQRPLSWTRMKRNTARLARAGRELTQFSPSLYAQEPTPEELRIVRRQGRISTDARPFDKFERLEGKVTR